MAKKTTTTPDPDTTATTAETASTAPAGLREAPLSWAGAPLLKLKEIMSAPVPAGSIRTPGSVAAALNAAGVFGTRTCTGGNVASFYSGCQGEYLAAIERGEKSVLPAWLEVRWDSARTPKVELADLD